MLIIVLLLTLLSQCNSLALDCLEVHVFNNYYHCNTSGCIYQSTKYNFCKTKHSWHDADAICRNEFNGSLITIANDSELDFINHTLSSYNFNLGPLWIGLYSNDNVNWYWTSHGEAIPINWQSSKPSGEIIPNCGYILSEKNAIKNLMADASCSTNYSFICKYKIPLGIEQVNPLVITVTSTTSTKTTSTATKTTSTSSSTDITTTTTTSTSSSTATTTSYTTTINTTSSSASLGTTSFATTSASHAPSILKSSVLSNKNNIIISTTIIIPILLIILVVLFIRHNRKLLKKQNNMISSQIELYNLENQSQSQNNSIVENNKLYETTIRVDDKYYDVKTTTNPIYDNSDDAEGNAYAESNAYNEINTYDIGANNYVLYNNVNFINDEYYDVNVDD